MSEIQPTTYPNTEFINEITTDLHPQSVNLVRGTYLALYFGQMDTAITTGFAGVASKEPWVWQPYELDDYEQIYFSAERFFEGGGAEKVAKASMPKEIPLIQQTTAIEIQQAKEQILLNCWNIMSSNKPARHHLQGAPSAIERLRLARNPAAAKAQIKAQMLARIKAEEISMADVRKLYNDQSRSNVARYLNFQSFIAQDLSYVRDGRPIGWYEQTPHESMTREVVLRSASTLSIPLNEHFANWQALVALGIMKPEMKELRKAWSKSNNATDLFSPERLSAPPSILPSFIARALFRGQYRKWAPEIIEASKAEES